MHTIPSKNRYSHILKRLTYTLKLIPYHAVNSTTSKVNVYPAQILIFLTHKFLALKKKEIEIKQGIDV